jgi:SWI/SNF-related matrix-associated actin-dependent regulator 1 of chromatin subfamily A
VDPLRFHTFYPWGETFCGARDRRIGHKVVRTYDGSARLPQLAKVTTPYVLRREKRSVLTDLPPKRRQRLVLPTNDSLSSLTRSVLDEVRAQAQDERGSNRALGMLGELRQHIGLAKIDAAVEWAQDARANDEPVVIFVYHREVGNQLKARLLKEGMRVGMILGDTPAKDRQSLVDAFQLRHHDDCVEGRCVGPCGVRQHGPLDILIGSEAIKEGITLVRAALSLQVEYWWSPGDLEQAEDRLCRNGQDRPVLNVYLHLDGTLDDHVAMLLEDKRDTVRQSLARDGFHKALLERLAGAS